MHIFFTGKNHVAAKYVQAVIGTVLTFVNRKANKLPSISIIHNMNFQSGVKSEISCRNC